MNTRKLGPVIVILLTLVLVPFAQPPDGEVDRFILEIQGLV